MRTSFTKCCLSCLLLMIPASHLAQNQAYDSILTKMHLREYTVFTKTDTLYFLCTVPDKKKKTLVFCQGSGPAPLILQTPEGIYPPFPFTIDKNARAEFNIVIISKPGLKRLASLNDVSGDLLKQGQILQLDSLNRPPQKYTKSNSLYKLGADCIDVIRFLRRQPWVDKDSLYVWGHSQGAIVAAYVASEKPRYIAGLIYCQANAYGQFAGYLSSLLAKQPSADLNGKMDSVYRMHASLMAGEPDTAFYNTLREWNQLPDRITDKKNSDFYDGYTGRWRSLEDPPAINYLLTVDKPVLMINGLASTGEIDNKDVPLDFIRHNKRNLTAKFYPGYDHNFFRRTYDDRGNEKEPEAHWDDIFKDVREWIKYGK